MPQPPKKDDVDLQKLFFRILSFWYLFALSLFLALVCAWFYNNYTLTRYRVSSTILIEEGKKSAAMGTDQILQGFGLNPSMQNLDNQIQILTSWSLIGRAIDSLPFGVEYYYRGWINKTSLYPKHPITVFEEAPGTLPFEIEFELRYLDDNKFTLDAESNRSFELHKEASFGESIEIENGSFRIECDSSLWFSDNEGQSLYFTLHSRLTLQENYRKRFLVEPTSREATVVRLTLEGSNKNMDIDFLNMLAEVFLNYNLDKKNKEANITIEFIDEQLVGITDSLQITEEKLQKFRSSNLVMNLSAQGQVIIDQAMKLENDKALLVIESNYFSYLAEYLSKDNIGKVPIAPATIGITDPGLTRLVMDLAELQGQFYSRSLGERNPLQGQLAQRLKNTKDALRETLRGVMEANELALEENRRQTREVNAKAAALPVTEREILGIERQFKLNDVLYTFLLEKKSEAQIQKASNSPDNEIIDPARPDREPVAPKTRLSYFIAILAGFGFPFICIMVADAFDYRVKDEEDLNGITDLPVAGHIPHSLFKLTTVFFEEHQSHIAEAFRSLRSRMQFFTKDIKSPVIIITSSMPEEGKTFNAINLASAYSMMGMQTVLVGFDLRKPKIFDAFNIDNDRGVSTWLIGRDSIDDIIKTTDHDNLSIIPSGPVPPNPSELTSSNKTDELFTLLRERFDYIIIDSSPIGFISDTFHLATLADTTLLIVRQNNTLKHLLERTIKEMKSGEIKNVSLVINDIRSEGKGYGGRYGYRLWENVYGIEKKK